MPVTPFPALPQRNQPATFADDGDAFLAALPVFAAELTALEANVMGKEISAGQSAQVALAQAAAAVGAAFAAGALAWVSGATYAPGACVFSGVNLQTYRRTTAGAGTLDPSNDAANWTRIQLSPLERFSYALRAELRARSPQPNDAVVVEGLGLFAWVPGSSEIDDDESCFATATGCWLLEAASWELLEAWGVVERLDPLGVAAVAASSFATNFPISFDARFTSKVLTGSASCAISSLSAISSASFTGTVAGAAVGDRVIATPPGQLGSTSADTARLGCHAWVSAANTVTVMLTNASAATATTNSAIRTGWPLTVIKP